MRYLFSILLFSIPILGFGQYCTPDDRFTEVDYFSFPQIDILRDIEFGQALDWQNVIDTLELDAYLPKTTVDTLSQRPMVMFIHGGGFQSGDKAQSASECLAFAKRGYVAFSINYRTGWDTQVSSDQQLATYRAHQDAHAALRFIVDQAAVYNIDTNWIFVGGSSAGGVTALNLVHAEQTEWDSIYPGIQTQLGAVSTSSNNLTNTFDIKGVFNNWGAAHGNTIDRNELRPIVSFHGTLDAVVSIDSGVYGLVGSGILNDILLSEGVCSELTEKLNGTHGIYQGQVGATFRVSRASCFFKSLFCNDCNDFYTNDSIHPTCSLPTALSTTENDQKIYAYPNPFSESFQLKHLTGTEHFRLIHSDGRIVYNGKIMAELDITALVSGIYFLQIQSAECRQTIKLLKL